jgi:hypothetical protein
MDNERDELEIQIKGSLAQGREQKYRVFTLIGKLNGLVLILANPKCWLLDFAFFLGVDSKQA